MAVGKKTGGRQRGAKNKSTLKRKAEIAASGKSPLDVMLDNMRFADEEAARVLGTLIDRGSPLPEDFIEFKELLRLRSLAQDCAKDAAPYVHPRLASIEHKGDDDHPIAHAITVRFVKAGGQPK